MSNTKKIEEMMKSMEEKLANELEKVGRELKQELKEMRKELRVRDEMIEALKKDADVKERKIESMNKRILSLEEERRRMEKNNQREEINKVRNKVTILKSPLDKNADDLTVMSNLNGVLQTKLALKDIQVNNYRKVNGPIVITFYELNKKIEFMQQYKVHKQNKFIIVNTLTREALNMRRQALTLKEKGIIQKVWAYRGKIFFELAGSSGWVEATLENLESLRGEETHLEGVRELEGVSSRSGSG